jgi:hypothetical protein
MQIRFEKLDEKGKVIPNEWEWFDTNKVENAQLQADVNGAISKVSTVAVVIEALSFWRVNTQLGIRKALTEADAGVEAPEAVAPEAEQETKKAK